MNAVSRVFLATLLIAAAPLCGNAEDVAAECFAKEVEAHVAQQFSIYGPQSADHEYFAFIYRHEGTIGSAVTRSRPCSKSGKCVVESAAASVLIPHGAKVLGEWHTHPHTQGSSKLSAEDVRGAHNNCHIRCYSAYYSKPTGEIYAWDSGQTSVPTAMASRVLLGSYMEQVAATGDIESGNTENLRSRL